MADDLTTHLFTTAYRVVDEWDLDVASIELASRSENVVFKLTTETGEHYALRLHRPGYNTLEELHSELMWTDALRSDGINTPHHVSTRTGQGYAAVMLKGSDTLHHAGIIEWLDGELLHRLIGSTEGTDSLHYFEQLGDIIARVHNQAARWTLPEGFTRRRWNAEFLMGETPLWGRFWDLPELSPEQRALLFNAKEAIHARLIDLGQSAQTFGLMHADLHPRNVIVTNESVYLIDFDDCGFGWHHYELAIALYQYRDQDQFEERLNTLLRGYRNIRTLAQEDVDLLSLFFLIRSLALLGWLNDRRDVDHASWIPAQIKMACREAEAFLETS